VVALVRALMDEWPVIKGRMKDTNFAVYADQLYRIIVERRR
jgi:hypothetical protein